MYGICCVPFLFGKPLVKNTFFKSFSKINAPQIVNLKSPGLDLIRRIHPECGFYGLISNPFLDLPKKRKIRFWIRKSGFWFSQKNPLKVNQTAQWPLTKKANSSSDKSYDSPDIGTTLYSLASLGFALYVEKRAIELCKSLTSQWKQTFYARSR